MDMDSASASSATGISVHSPEQTVSTNTYIESRNTVLCNSAVSTYISAMDSWTTWTPATCMTYNATVVPGSATPSSTSSPLAITNYDSASGSGSFKLTTYNGISTYTEFSSTAITTTVTPSASAEIQTNDASKQILSFGVPGLACMAWIIYFSYWLVRC